MMTFESQIILLQIVFHKGQLDNRQNALGPGNIQHFISPNFLILNKDDDIMVT